MFVDGHQPRETHGGVGWWVGMVVGWVRFWLFREPRWGKSKHNSRPAVLLLCGAPAQLVMEIEI